MHSDFYTTLGGHQSLSVKRILKDDKMYQLLFGSRESNPDPRWNSTLDDLLYLYITNKCHKSILDTLKSGLFRVSVYKELRTRFGLPVCETADEWKRSTKQWWSMSERKKHILIIELINRFYNDDFGFKQFQKPLTHRKVIHYKPTRKQKYKKYIAIKNAMLTNPYA